MMILLVLAVILLLGLTFRMADVSEHVHEIADVVGVDG